ncbi:MAG: heavy metal translocating P-type ATPase [Proteobacteria bacterium]|nr:heavy metal translocating P-type ATPase [Pseudomonadota bacterium]NIS67874.1 heavy metal translocating P-type ATPase [Pseudomonadota bacterium]
MPATAGRRERCDLCGLPIGRSQAKQAIRGGELCFCCPGCQYVFELLSNRPEGAPTDFRKTELFKACIEAGIIPQDEADLLSQQAQTDVHDQDGVAPREGSELAHAQDLTFRVEGMWCAACARLIEEVLRKTEGILEAQVYFLSDMAQIKYLPGFLSLQDIFGRISPLGYRASLFRDSAERSKERRDLLLRLGISGFLTANVMMISFALYFGFFQELSQEAIGYLSYPIWLLSTPVVFYGGFSILKRAIFGLRCLRISMDTLISIGILSAYGYSIIQMARGSLHLYFDTASMLVTLMLLGRYIETQAKGKVSRGITELYRLASQKVRLLSDGKERWVTPDAVQPRDEFLALSDERIPLDGQVIEGQGEVDESVLTGESRPLRKGLGDEVIGGAHLLEGKLRLRVTRVGCESVLGQMIQLMQEALSKKNPTEDLADQLIRWLVPAILALAGCTIVYLRSKGVSVDETMLRAITVLVITCPCALGIATPLAKVGSIAAVRTRGILIRDPGGIERAKDINTLVLDKTGTVTKGDFSLLEVFTLGIDEKEALGRVASVEVHSEHLLARRILWAAREASLELQPTTGFEVSKGLGVKGVIGKEEVFVGNRRFMDKEGIVLAPSLEEIAESRELNGATVVFFGWQRVVQGFLAFGDSIRENVQEFMGVLRSKGIMTCLVSGDAEETTRAVAAELDVDKFFGQAIPEDKVEFIKDLQERGFRVGMVGDGMNDAAALAQADVSFALGTKSNIAQGASDINILTDDPIKVIEVLNLSALTMRIIRQNLFFALFYNALGIPLAVAGALNPLVAVLAMFASSLTVITNTLRISRRHLAQQT